MDELQCWKCGAGLVDVPVPLPRRAECPACEADLHVCLMCEFYAPSVAKSCREPVAEEVKDKDRANFCDYLRPRPGAHTPPDAAGAQTARDQLESLFGLDPAEATAPAENPMAAARARREAQAEEARRRLDDLFGLEGGEKD